MGFGKLILPVILYFVWEKERQNEKKKEKKSTIPPLGVLDYLRLQRDG